MPRVCYFHPLTATAAAGDQFLLGVWFGFLAATTATAIILFLELKADAEVRP